MSRMFKTRKFTEAVLVNLKLKPEYARSGLIGDILQFTMENNIDRLEGGSTTGGGMYIAFHTKQDALKIEKFVHDWVKKGKNENS